MNIFPNYTINDKCSNCGHCCSNLLYVSKEEILRIKEYIKRNGILEQIDNIRLCPFRDEKNQRCLIYEVRPSICKGYLCNQSDEMVAETAKQYEKTSLLVFMRDVFYHNLD